MRNIINKIKLKYILISLLLITALLPQITSTLGKPLFKKSLEAKTKGDVQLGKIRLSWFGPQKFEDILWKKDLLKAEIKELEIHAPFWSFSGAFTLKDAKLYYQGTQVETLSGSLQGDLFDLTGERLSLQGTPEDFTVQATDFPTPYGLITKLKAHLTRQGNSLTLLSPASASFLFESEELKSLTATHLKLESAHIPLPLSLNKLETKGTIDLGKMSYVSDAKTRALLALLNASATKKMNIWASPFAFEIKEGKCFLGRFDFLLADSLHLCLWGHIDLPNRLHLVLGLTASTLERSFHIPNLPTNYVMKVDVRGTLKDPEIVKKPVAAKIATLLAATGLPKNTTFGAIASAIATPKEEKDVPPAKRPFPWER